MDGIIENIYEIAASIREAGKEERLLEKELKMSLAEIKKLAKNWTKQKSVKLPKGKVVTKKQFDGGKTRFLPPSPTAPSLSRNLITWQTW